MRHVILLAASLVVALHAGEATVPATPPALVKPVLAWTELTDWVNGAVKGITVMSVTPGGDQVILGLADRGLFVSSDGRKAWLPIAKDQSLLQQKSVPCQVIFDPTDAKIFWLASRTGAGLFTTVDGGATLTRVGNVESVSLYRPSRREFGSALGSTPATALDSTS